MWLLVLCQAQLEREARAAGHAGSAVEVWELDISSLKSVRAFGKRWDSSGRPIHVLVNNAGEASC